MSLSLTPFNNTINAVTTPLPRVVAADKPADKTVTPKFGNGVGQVFNTVMGKIESNRTLELFVEDLLGMGALRTGIDYNRGYFLGLKEKKNKAAGEERALREVCSFITDIFAAGLVAKLLGWALDGFKSRKNGFSQDFVSFKSLDAFNKLLNESPVKDRQSFNTALAEKLATNNTAASAKEIRTILNSADDNSKKLSATATDKATKIAKLLKQENFDVTINNKHFGLDALLEDAEILGKRVREKATKTNDNWLTVAKSQLKKTVRNKKIQLIGMPIAAAMTFSVPFFSRWVTRKVFKIYTYPGEQGLASFDNGQQKIKNYFGNPLFSAQQSAADQFSVTNAGNSSLYKGRIQVGRNFSPFVEPTLENSNSVMPIPGKSTNPAFDKKFIYTVAQSKTKNPELSDQQESGFQKLFPYVSEKLSKGNPLPLLMSVVPSLVFATGLFFNTTTRRFIKKPFQGGFKGISQRLQRTFDFGKGFPHTTGPQIASLFGLLIIGRLLTSRTPIEFRERLMDSVAGWSLLIMGTPTLKRFFARKRLDLLKTDQFGRKVLKTSKEVKAFASKKGQKAYTNMGRGALGLNILLLGIIEPIAAILWTKAAGSKTAGTRPA